MLKSNSSPILLNLNNNHYFLLNINNFNINNLPNNFKLFNNLNSFTKYYKKLPNLTWFDTQDYNPIQIFTDYYVFNNKFSKKYKNIYNLIKHFQL